MSSCVCIIVYYFSGNIYLFAAEKRHAEARYHFLYCSDGESCGRFLVEYHHDCGGNALEVDLFIAQMVLQ